MFALKSFSHPLQNRSNRWDQLGYFRASLFVSLLSVPFLLQSTTTFAQETAPNLIVPPPITSTLPSKETLTTAQPSSVAREEEGPINLFSPVDTNNSEVQQEAAPEKRQPLPPSTPNENTPKNIITEETLEHIDLATIGLMDATSGGFPLNIWAQTSRDNLLTTLKNLPTDLSSPILRQITKRLLLTSAEIPKPAHTYTTQELEKTALELIKARAHKLIELGHPAKARDLITIAGLSETQLQSFAPILFEIAILEANFELACELIQSQNAYTDELQNQKFLTFCHFYQNNLEGAQFGLTLLQDLNAEDPAFFAIAEHLSGLESEFPPQVKPNHLNLSMLSLASDIPISKDFYANLPPRFLKLALSNPYLSEHDKLALTEKAIINNLISPAMLHDIYATLKFSDDELATPISTAEKAFTPRHRALLFYTASKDKTEETRSLIIAKALELGQKHQKYTLITQIFSDLILQMPIKNDLWAFSGHAAKALYTLNRPKPAQAWFNILQSQSKNLPAAQEALGKLWAFARLSANETIQIIEEDTARKIWVKHIQTLTENEDEVENLQRVNTVYQLLETLERPSVSLAAWQELTTNNLTILSISPNPGLMKLLEIKSSQQNIGETLVQLLHIFTQVDTQHLSIDTMQTIIQALKNINLNSEANALAMEFALHSGI